MKATYRKQGQRTDFKTLGVDWYNGLQPQMSLSVVAGSPLRIQWASDNGDYYHTTKPTALCLELEPEEAQALFDGLAHMGFKASRK